MGRDSHNAFTARIRSIMHTAHALKEAIAVSYPPIHSLSNGNVANMIDTIHLPSPQPLLPLLLEAGMTSEMASSLSLIYQQRAEELKQNIQESIARTYTKAPGSPAVHAHVSFSDILVKKGVPIFADIYSRCLEGWKEEILQRAKQASRLPTKVLPRVSRAFNQEYIPLLEHFFEANPFPTHADKMFLAKKSNMEYKQIHVWFQNRRSRTKKEGKTLRKKVTCDGAAVPLDQLYEHARDNTNTSNSRALERFKTDLSKETIENMSMDAFTSSSPPHAFPSLYPPTCPYDPFPCKSGPVCFSKPEWRRVPDAKPPLPPSASHDLDDLVERFFHLSVRGETQSKGTPRFPSNAATVAITVVPSRAPHPSLIASEYFQPTDIIQLRPLIPVTYSEVFKSSYLISTPTTLAPLLSNRCKFPERRKVAPLPRRVPEKMGNAHRNTTPSESSSTSPSLPRLFSSDAESRSCSFSSISSLSTPSDSVSSRELPLLFGSPYGLPLNSPV